MTNKPMTTQSERDELHDCNHIPKEVIAFMDSLGFDYTSELKGGLKCNHKLFVHRDNRMTFFAEQAAFIHQRELSLLDEVEKRVISNEVHVRHVCPPESCLGYKARREMRTKQRQTLQAMRSERNL